MRSRMFTRTVLISCTLVILVILSPSVAGNAYQDQAIRWAVRIYPPDPNKIQVFVDSTNLQRNQVIRGAKVVVEFYDERSRPIETKTYRLADQTPGRYFLTYDHPFKSARSVRPIDLSITVGGLGTGGSNYDTGTSYVTREISWADAIRNGMISPDPTPVILRPRDENDTNPSILPPGLFVSRIAEDQRQKLREFVLAGKSVTSVAFTRDGGWVILHGRNEAWWSDRIPKGASEAINELNREGSIIKCIAFTPSGGWVIIYDKNGCWQNNIPQGALDNLIKLNKTGNTIDLIAFAPNGGWVVISEKK